MTKPDGIPNDSAAVSAVAAWGTWEDLLLAFAVNRHGSCAWDAIASELQKRTPYPAALSLTPQNCRTKFLDLKRRFLGDPPDDDGDDAKSDTLVSAPLLEELRKLRVAELRREVKRYDLNIESLELKMKTMEEERERSLRREESESDLKKTDEKANVMPETELVTVGEPVAGEESEKDQLSVNESNSTDPEAEKLRPGEKESEPDRTGGDREGHDGAGQTGEEPTGLKRELDQKSIREDSCNGSSNSIQELDRKAKAEPAGTSAGLLESEAESDGGRGEEATKENSDVQSSASRSRKEEGSDKVRRSSTSGDDCEHEDQSRAAKELSTESQPLVGFLQAIRGHKFGSVFERRLRSQESSKYQKLVLQHIDLETIDSRLKEGCYSGSSSMFFRDLLLLVNNALVFFSKNSAEANAATEIRWLISKEISQKHTKSDSSTGKHVSLQSLSMSKKEEPEPSRTLMLKPLTACRKRSSIAAKATAAATTSIKKKEQTSSPTEEKDTKLLHATEEPKITKKRTRDRFSAVSTNTKKNGKNQPNNNIGSKNPVDSGKQQGKGGGGSTSSSQHGAESKGEHKKNQASLDSKRQGAANLLNRMKQGSSSNNNGALLDALKNTPLTTESSSGKGGGEVKKNENPKRGEKKEAKKSSETKAGGKEKGSPGKRNVGRPPKRGAAAAPPPLGKRSREGGGTESPAASSKPPPKKRSRKL